MPIFRLNDEPVFPDPTLAEDGIIAVGGDLSVPRLLEAYRHGIFPWYSDGEPIIWWSPDPRYILKPAKIIISRSMRKIMARREFSITMDTAFERVISACRMPREYGNGTWITDEMTGAYIDLHRAGFAHSIEAWSGGELAGGLYGVSLGKAFFGESMFSLRANASKAALIFLARKLEDEGFSFIDCQVYTAHLVSMGSEPIPRDQFLALLSEALKDDPAS